MSDIVFQLGDYHIVEKQNPDLSIYYDVFWGGSWWEGSWTNLWDARKWIEAQQNGRYILKRALLPDDQEET